MNNNKICFIYCVNDEVQYTESLNYVQSLLVPEGLEIDVIAVNEAKSLTAGYNYAMNNSDAKYKVYMHQDTLIINKNFIFDILTLFQMYPKLGLLGMVGASQLPSNGVWWETRQTFGKVYDTHTGTMELLSFQDVHSDYARVSGIDGFMMVTQYDIPWREDLFRGWHFYDLSQSVEFLKAGYEVGVPRQDKPWCIHDCGIVNVRNGFEDNRRIFLEEYSERLFISNNKDLPLVSVLIPAYNRPHYLELALQSVLNQTYNNIEIIICDDSTNDEVQQMIQPYIAEYRHIQYYRNGKQLNFYNLQKLLSLAQGKYVNYLCDDDLFHQQKIEIMVSYMEQNEQISLVTSSRKLIDENGSLLHDLPFNKALFSKDTIIQGERLGNFLLSSGINIIGEPTTVLFRRTSLHENFGVYQGYEYIKGMVDVSTWLSLLSNGFAIYIATPLSYFRQHSGQNQRDLAVIVPSIREWHQLIMSARNKGYLRSEKDYKKSLISHLKGMQYIFETAIEAGKEEILMEFGAEECMSYAANELVHCKNDYYCPHCSNKLFSFKPWPDHIDFTKYEFEMYNKETFLCPECSAMDRERLYRLYIEQETKLLKIPLRLLHIAPERHIRSWLSNYDNIDYTGGDLFPTDAALVRVDVTDIYYHDETFDVVMCSHVLEHVPDDRKAMRELYRVLKKGGWGILQVPLAVDITETYEDFSITTPEGRFEAFGQDDHVRVYAQQDYINRLKEAGFEVELYNYATKYGLSEAKKYGLSKNDNLYVVHKK